MSKRSLELLKRVKVANLSNFNKDTLSGIIPRYSKPKYDVDGCYIVELDDSLLTNTNDMLVTNWNNGTHPNDKVLKICVSKVLGKMIYVYSTAFNLATNTDTVKLWTGWLPTENIKLIRKL